MNPRTATAQFPGAPSSARLARAFVSETLGSWERDKLADVVVLLTSELITNAVLHARTAVTVTVSLDERRIRIEVHDGDPQLPAMRPYDLEDATGRGLPMIAAYAAAWGADPRPDGKVVWFEIDT